jgi:hypothetical protein
MYTFSDLGLRNLRDSCKKNVPYQYATSCVPSSLASYERKSFSPLFLFAVSLFLLSSRSQAKRTVPWPPQNRKNARNMNILSEYSVPSINWTKECVAFTLICKRMKSQWHLIVATSISMIATLAFQYRFAGTRADDSMYQLPFADTMHEGFLMLRSCRLHSKGNMQIYSAKSTYCKCAHLSRVRKMLSLPI